MKSYDKSNVDDIFQRYNNKWIDYCEHHNRKLSATKIDPRAFHDYAISKTSERFLYEPKQEDSQECN